LILPPPPLLPHQYVIAALVVASRLSKSETPAATQPTAFAAIWSMILLVCILVGGTVVFKRYGRTRILAH
jgi:hypothetical protein